MVGESLGIEISQVKIPQSSTPDGMELALVVDYGMRKWECIGRNSIMICYLVLKGITMGLRDLW